MKTVVYIVLIVASMSVLASESLLRVTCDEESSGAEISIDGKFKGECPLDFSVQEGNHVISAVKNVDEEHIHRFEHSFRIGEGVIKRLDIILGPAQLNEIGKNRKAARELAEAQRLAEIKRQEKERQRIEKLRLARLEEDSEWQRAGEEDDSQVYLAYVAKYPNGRYVDQARKILEKYKNLPAKPRFKNRIKDKIWIKIVNTDAYRNAPTVTSEVKVKIHATQKTQPNSWLVKNTTEEVQMEITTQPVSEKCYSITHTYPLLYAGLDCGTIPISTEESIENIDIDGSLFPLQPGASQTLHYTEGGSKHTSSCKVINSLPAKKISEKLSGEAWEIRCSWSYSNASAGDHRDEYTTYYLSDLRLFMDQIGVLDQKNKTFIIPSPGYETVNDYSHLEYGGKQITTYHDYELLVNKQPVISYSQ